MVTLKYIETKIINWSKTLSLIGLLGLLCLSIITVGAVLLRAVFGITILGVYDASELIVVVVVASCFPLASAERGHIRVKVLGPKIGPRTNHLFEAFSAFVSLVFFFILTVQLWKYVFELIATNESTWIVHIPLFPWWVVAAILIAFCIPIELICFLSSLGSVFKPQKESVKY